MTLGISDRRYRRRRQGRLVIALVRWVFVLLVAIFAGYYAYDFGLELARKEVRVLETKMYQTSLTLEQLKTDIVGLETALRAERALVAKWRDHYESEVPGAEDKELLIKIHQRIKKGVSRKRISEIITLAQKRDVCEPLQVTRRFVVQNPVYAGPNDNVSFANNSILVTAIGKSKINNRGRPEAWFDPAKKVVVYFTKPGGETTSAEGVLPLHHAVVVGDKEYRFSIVSGMRSFVEISGRKCDYP